MNPYLGLATLFYPMIPAIIMGWISTAYMVRINSLAKKIKPDFLLHKRLADPIKSLGLRFKFLFYGLTLQLFRKTVREEIARVMYNFDDIKELKDPKLVKMVEKLALLNAWTFFLFVIGGIGVFIKFFSLP